MLDLLLRGGTVVDGTGAPARRADVGIRDGRLVTGGELTGELAADVLDVSGLVVCPGFIDMHAHADLALLREPAAPDALLQGVTCEVLGQDGLAYAPIDDTIAAELHARIRSWNGPEPPGGLTWTSVADYLDRVDGAGVNVAYLAPHGTIRMLAMGTEERRATAVEMTTMRRLLAEALTDGAVGMSTGLTYVPATYADTTELIDLCRVVAAHGGFFAPHHRSYGAAAMAAYAECVEIARASGAALHLTHAHLSFPVNRGRARDLLTLVDQARADGVDVTLDSYPYLAGASYLHAFLPSWIQAGTVDQVIDRLADPQVRARLHDDLEVNGCDGSHGLPVDWSTVLVSGVEHEADAGVVGSTIAEIAARQGVPPLDAYCDLLISNRLGAMCLVFAGDEDNVRAILQHPAHMAGSDGLLEGERPHPRAYGTFARYLAWAVRDEGLVSIEEMVRKMTSAPAGRLGLADRGRIRPGMAADVVCLDPATVQDRATYENPRQPPQGIAHVIVNGSVAVQDGQLTGALAGRSLRRSPGSVRTPPQERSE